MVEKLHVQWAEGQGRDKWEENVIQPQSTPVCWEQLAGQSEL